LASREGFQFLKDNGSLDHCGCRQQPSSPLSISESRRPTWRFPNVLLIAREPADVHSTLEKAHRALAQSFYPKLLFAGNPSGLISPSFAESFAKGLKNCRVVLLSSGIHYLQKDHSEVTSVYIFPARAVNRHVQMASVAHTARGRKACTRGRCRAGCRSPSQAMECHQSG
jgi:hypothetical protein